MYIWVSRCVAWPTHAACSRRLGINKGCMSLMNLERLRVESCDARTACGRSMQHVTAPSSGAAAALAPGLRRLPSCRLYRPGPPYHRRCPPSCLHLSATIAHPGALRYSLQAAPADRTFSAAPATQSKGTARCHYGPVRLRPSPSPSPSLSSTHTRSSRPRNGLPYPTPLAGPLVLRALTSLSRLGPPPDSAPTPP
jgi:hypothetical protein